MKQLKKNELIKKVCDYYEISKADLFSKSRKIPIPEAKQVIFYYLQINRIKSQQSIADLFGYKQSSTICTLVQRFKNRMDVDKTFKQKVNEILK
jgi:chromosomal replication initiation ATPase DnaA